jgi:hypothetical protein
MQLVFIARANDGLIFTETWEDSRMENAAALKQMAKQLLCKVNDGPAKCSVETGSGSVFQ